MPIPTPRTRPVRRLVRRPISRQSIRRLRRRPLKIVARQPRRRPPRRIIVRPARRPPRRPPHRRRPLSPQTRVIARRPWWGYGSPPGLTWVQAGRRGPEPLPPRWTTLLATLPGMRRYSHNGYRTLWRYGLLHGVWIDQLASADEELVRFVNRFYDVPGFHHVVRDYFGGPYRRRVARLAMRLVERLVERLAARRPAAVRTLRFRRALGVGPAGLPVRAIELVSGRIRYLLLPWPRLDDAAARQLLRRSAALYGTPEAVRWVFDGDGLRQPRSVIVRELRRALRPSGSGGGHRWLAALDRLVLMA